MTMGEWIVLLSEGASERVCLAVPAFCQQQEGLKMTLKKSTHIPLSAKSKGILYMCIHVCTHIQCV